MENNNLPINSSSLVNILTLRYDSNLKPNLPKKTSHDFQPNNKTTDVNLIEKSIVSDIEKKLETFDDEKISIALSGGVDSTLVLSLIRKVKPDIDIQAISIRFADSVDETQDASKIAKTFDAEHHIVHLENYLSELPTAISMIKMPFWDLHWYYVVKKSRSLSKILVSGDGGDELLGGYTFRYKKFLEQTSDISTSKEKIISYLNCHERDWVPEQEEIFNKNLKFSWNEIHETLKPYFDNSLPRLTQVFLADFNGKLLHNMQPLYDQIHKNFNIQNISPILNKQLIQLSCQLSNEMKYDQSKNKGKLPLLKILDKYNITNLISQKKQGFSVNTLNMWNSYAKKIFFYYFDNSRLIEDGIINSDWVKKYSKNTESDVRHVNKFLGLLALEIWYRLFITNDLDSNTKLEL